MSNFLAQYLVDFATFLPSEEKVRDVIANASRLTTGLVNPNVLAPNPSPTKVLFGNNTWGDVTLTIPEDVVRDTDLAAIAFSGSANDLISGTIPLLRLPSEVARRDQANTFSQNQIMTQALTIGGVALARKIAINANSSFPGRIEFIESNGFTYGYIGLSGTGLDIENTFSNRVNINNPLVVTGSTTATSFIRSGGTSAQFLKADGSVDSNSYYLASNPSNFITGNQSISITGDATGTGTTSIALTLSNSGVAAGTYNNSSTQIRPFTIDTKGRVTNIGTAVTITPAWSSITGTPTTLSGYGITDAVTGTGTINYLSKFTSAGSIGNSQLFDNGTNVGIGTASPIYTLDISSSSASIVRFTNSSRSQIIYQDSGGGGIMTPALSGVYSNDAAVAVIFSGTSKFVVNSSGDGTFNGRVKSTYFQFSNDSYISSDSFYNYSVSNTDAPKAFRAASFTLNNNDSLMNASGAKLLTGSNGSEDWQFLNSSNSALGVKTGSLVVSNSYADIAPTNGLFVLGDATIGRQYFSKTAYHFDQGILIRTNIPFNSDSMMELTIEGNGYFSGQPVFARVQAYNYAGGGNIIISTGAICNTPGLTFDVFHHSGFVCFWFSQINSFETYTIKLITPFGPIGISSVTNSAKPTSGVTNSITITPSKIWTQSNDGASSGLDADLLDGQHGSYYASASSINGTINYIPKFTASGSIGNSSMTDNGSKIVSTLSAEFNAGIIVNGPYAHASSGVPGTISFEYPFTRHMAGDGSGYTWAVSKRVGGVTTDIFTIYDATNAATFSADLNVNNKGRFLGWSTSGVGRATEIGNSGGIGYIYNFDRTTATHGDIVIGNGILTAVDSTGGILLGSGTSYGRLSVYGGAIYQAQDQPFVWHSSGTIRSQILGDSTDNLRFSTRQGGVLTEVLNLSNTGLATFSNHVTSTFQSLSSNPTTSDLTSGQCRIIKNTTANTINVWANDSGTMRIVGNSGDVVGPSTATDNAIARFNGTTGKLIQNSLAILDDDGNATFESLTTYSSITSGGDILTNYLRLWDPVELDYGTIRIENSEIRFLNAAGLPITSTLGLTDLSRVGHTHAASDITSGALIKARQHAQTAYKDEANVFTQAQKVTGASLGAVGLDPGGSVQIGHVSWYKPNGTRQAYMGYDSDNNVTLVNEVGGQFITGAATFNAAISLAGDSFVNGPSISRSADGLLLVAGATNGVRINNSTNGFELFRVQNNGNVGIGTATPRGILDVSQNDVEVYLGGSNAQCLVVGHSRRVNFRDMLIGRNLAGVTGADSYRTIHTGSFGYSGIDFQYGGDLVFFASNAATTQDAVVTPNARLVISGATGTATFNGIINSSTEFRLGSNTYSRVAQIDGAGGWAGGYNFNINGGTPQRDSTGLVSAIRFANDNVLLFAEGSGAPGAISARYAFSSTGANFTSPLTVPDEAYSATWDGSMQVPTKNAVYDRIQTLAGSISVAGSNTQVQYNNSGVFGASANFTFNSTTNVLTVTGTGSFSNSVRVADGANYDVIISGSSSGPSIQSYASKPLFINPLGNDTVFPSWHWIRDTRNRIYFQGDASTLVTGHGTHPVVVRNAGGSDIARFQDTGEQLLRGSLTVGNGTGDSGGSVATPARSNIDFMSAGWGYLSCRISGRTYAANLAYGDLVLSANPNIGILDGSNLSNDLVIRGNTGNVEVFRGQLELFGTGTANKLVVYNNATKDYVRFSVNSDTGESVFVGSSGTIRMQPFGGATQITGDSLYLRSIGTDMAFVTNAGTANNSPMVLRNNSVLFTSDSWHKDGNEANRFYFAGAGTTQLRGHGSLPFEFQNSSGTNLVTIDSSGSTSFIGLTTIGNADLYRVGRFYTPTGGLIEFGTLGNAKIGMQSLDNGGNFQRLQLQPNGGNVLIGTTTDDGASKLQVAGSITTKGNIAIDKPNTQYSLLWIGTQTDGTLLSGGHTDGNFVIQQQRTNGAIYFDSGAQGVIFRRNDTYANIATLSQAGVFSVMNGRPVTLNGNNGTVSMQASPGGWTMSTNFLGSSGTNRGGFGAYGSTNDLTYFWVGAAYDSPYAVFEVTGNVGIGTTTPLARTHISGPIPTGSSAANVLLLSRPYVGGVAYATSASFKLANPQFSSPFTRMDISLLDTASGVDTVPDVTVMSLLSNGRVGIGTTTPATTLELTNSGSAPQLRLNGGNNPWDLYATYANTNSDLFFRMNGSTKITFDANGNVINTGYFRSSVNESYIAFTDGNNYLGGSTRFRNTTGGSYKAYIDGTTGLAEFYDTNIRNNLYGSVAAPANTTLTFLSNYTLGRIQGRDYSANLGHGDLILAAYPGSGSFADDLVIRGNTGNVEINRGALVMKHSVWQVSNESSPKNRLYFYENGTTYIQGHGVTPLIVRNGSSSDIATLSTSGDLLLRTDQASAGLKVQSGSYAWFSLFEHSVNLAATNLINNYIGDITYGGWYFQNLVGSTMTTKAQIRGDGSGIFNGMVKANHFRFANDSYFSSDSTFNYSVNEADSPKAFRASSFTANASQGLLNVFGDRLQTGGTSTAPWLFLTSSGSALGVKAGSLVVSNDYLATAPTNGLYVKGGSHFYDEMRFMSPSAAWGPGHIQASGTELNIAGHTAISFRYNTGNVYGGTEVARLNEVELRGPNYINSRPSGTPAYAAFVQLGVNEWTIGNRVNQNFVFNNGGALMGTDVVTITPSGATTFGGTVTANGLVTHSIPGGSGASPSRSRLDFWSGNYSYRGGSIYTETYANDNVLGNMYLCANANILNAPVPNITILGASGNVGIGVTPDFKLHVSSSDTHIARFTNSHGTQTIFQNAGGGGILTPSLSGWYTTDTQSIYLASGGGLVYIYNATGNIETPGALTAGTGVTYGKLNVYGGGVYVDQEQPIVWHSAGTVRSRIVGDSTDNLRFSTRRGGVLTEALVISSDGSLTASGNIINGTTKTHNLTRTLPSVVGDYVDIGTFTFVNNGAGLLDIAVTVGIGSNSQTKFYKIPCSYNATANNWRKYPSIFSSVPYEAAQDFDLEFRCSNATCDLRIRKTLGTIGGTIQISIKQYGRVDIDTFTASTATGSGGAPTVIADEMFSNNLTVRDMGGSTQNLLTLKNYSGTNIFTVSNIGHITTWGGTSGNYLDFKDMSSNTHAYIQRDHTTSDLVIGYRQNSSGVLRTKSGATTTFKLDGSGNAEFSGTALASNPPVGSNNSLLATTSWTNALWNNMGDTHAANTNFNSVSDFGFRFIQGNTNGPGTGAPQFYCMALGLGSDYGYSQYALQLAIPRDNNGSNDNYLSIRIREAGTWGSWKKVSAGIADGVREYTWAGKPSASSTKGPIIITDTIPANSLWTSDGTVWRAQTRTRKVITFATTMTLDSSEAMVQRITLTNNLTLNKFTNGFDGASLELVLRQDGTGGRTLTFGTGFRFNDYITSIVLSTGADKTDRILFEYDSVSDVWDVISFVKGS